MILNIVKNNVYKYYKYIKNQQTLYITMDQMNF